MERLSFKQFISNNLKEAKGWFGNFSTDDAKEASLISSGRTPSSSVEGRDRINAIYGNTPEHRKFKYNFADTYGDTIQTLRRSGKIVDRSSQIPGLIQRTRDLAIPFISKILKESRKSRFKNPLYVFDFDDTIAKNSGRVKVTDNNTGEVRHLSTTEFATFVPQPHHSMDFSEFNTVVNPVSIKPVHKILRNMKRTGRSFTILTARPQQAESSIRDYLRSKNLHHDGVRIIGLGSSDPRAKANYLRQVLSSNDHDHLMFMDDAGANVEHVARLSQEFPFINIRARHINYHR